MFIALSTRWPLRITLYFCLWEGCSAHCGPCPPSERTPSAPGSDWFSASKADPPAAAPPITLVSRSFASLGIFLWAVLPLMGPPMATAVACTCVRGSGGIDAHHGAGTGLPLRGMPMSFTSTRKWRPFKWCASFYSDEGGHHRSAKLRSFHS